jgi:hypothetical protein
LDTIFTGSATLFPAYNSRIHRGNLATNNFPAELPRRRERVFPELGITHHHPLWRQRSSIMRLA